MLTVSLSGDDDFSKSAQVHAAEPKQSNSEGIIYYPLGEAQPASGWCGYLLNRILNTGHSV
jgi:hypothetical protein